MPEVLKILLLPSVHGHFAYSESTCPSLWKCLNWRKFLLFMLDWKKWEIIINIRGEDVGMVKALPYCGWKGLDYILCEKNHVKFFNWFFRDKSHSKFVKFLVYWFEICKMANIHISFRVFSMSQLKSHEHDQLKSW